MSGLTLASTAACPCGLSKTYSDCCFPFISGASDAPTAEKLMRSRYTAFVVHDFNYIYKTWHPDYRPSLLELVQGPHNDWVGLQVKSSKKGTEMDKTGQVAFEARFMERGKEYVMQETSDFVRVNAVWLYTKGH